MRGRVAAFAPAKIRRERALYQLIGRHIAATLATLRLLPVKVGLIIIAPTHTSKAELSQARVIKKYPNRRLYDTEQSKYITLSDLRKLIADGTDIEVQDANSGADITRQILLQIINEQEAADQPLFTTEILTRMIRFYGGQSQGLFTDYLERTLEMFLEQQQQYQNRFAEFLGQTPMDTLSDMASRNMEIWTDMQKRMLEGASMFSKDSKARGKK